MSGDSEKYPHRGAFELGCTEHSVEWIDQHHLGDCPWCKLEDAITQCNHWEHECFVARNERDSALDRLRILAEHTAGFAAERNSALGRLGRIRALVDEQAEDEGLWAVPIPPQLQPISEAYLQQELRRLHAEAESVVETPDEIRDEWGNVVERRSTIASTTGCSSGQHEWLERAIVRTCRLCGAQS